MYRKQQASEKTPGEQELKSDFLKRVSLLPLITMTTRYTVATYDRIKKSNVLAARTLSIAEKTLDVVAAYTHPLLLPLSGQIQMADNLACCGLNILEEKAPLITKPPEEILKDATELYNSTLPKSFDYYNELKSYGNEKIQQIKNNACQNIPDLSLSLYWKTIVYVLDKALKVAEQQADYYLPSTENEERKSTCCGINILLQAYYSNFNFSQMQYAREKFNITNWTKDSFQKNVYWLWEELNKETDPATKPATIGDKVLDLARQLTRWLVTSFNSLTPLSQMLPIALQDDFETAQNYSLRVYQQLHQAKDFNEMTSIMITELKQNLKSLGIYILYLLNHTFLEKLASAEAAK